MWRSVAWRGAPIISMARRGAPVREALGCRLIEATADVSGTAAAAARLRQQPAHATCLPACAFPRARTPSEGLWFCSPADLLSVVVMPTVFSSRARSGFKGKGGAEPEPRLAGRCGSEALSLPPSASLPLSALSVSLSRFCLVC